jgi:hypothetical protein
LGRPTLGDGGFGRVARLREEVSAAFELGDGPRESLALQEPLPLVERVLGAQQRLGLGRARARVEAG